MMLIIQLAIIILGAFCALSIVRCTAGPTENGSQWDHNGSTMTLLVNGAHSEFIFADPREGLRSEGVKVGATGFSGTSNGDEYEGTAYVFSKKCGAFGFQMKGTASSDRQRVTMSGQAPYVDAQCRIVGYHDAIYEFVRIVGPGSLQRQEGPVQIEDLGEDGKLYSREQLGTDLIKRFVLNRRRVNGEDGYSYDGKIRIVTEILGGGYTNQEVDYESICAAADGDPYVAVGEGDDQKRVVIDPNLRSPEQTTRSAYNLWWATCKNKFQRFR